MLSSSFTSSWSLPRLRIHPSLPSRPRMASGSRMSVPALGMQADDQGPWEGPRWRRGTNKVPPQLGARKFQLCSISIDSCTRRLRARRQRPPRNTRRWDHHLGRFPLLDVLLLLFCCFTTSELPLGEAMTHLATPGPEPSEAPLASEPRHSFAMSDSFHESYSWLKPPEQTCCLT